MSVIKCNDKSYKFYCLLCLMPVLTPILGHILQVWFFSKDFYNVLVCNSTSSFEPLPTFTYVNVNFFALMVWNGDECQFLFSELRIICKDYAWIVTMNFALKRAFKWKNGLQLRWITLLQNKCSIISIKILLTVCVHAVLIRNLKNRR